MKKIFLLLISLLFLYSCENTNDLTKNYNDKAQLAFDTQTVSVNVLSGSVSKNADISFSPLVASPGATVIITPVPLAANDTSIPAVLGVDYTIEATTVTLNGEISNKFIVKFNESTATQVGKKVNFKISSTSIPNAIFNQICSVIVKLSCPVLATQFVGNYLIQETTPFVDGPTLSTGTVVAVSVIAGSTGGAGRTFKTKHYPDYCSPLFDFNFDLTCNKIIARPNLAGICNCSGTGNRIGPATVSTSYVDGATNFTLRFTNDVSANCGPAVQTTYSFTKQ